MSVQLKPSEAFAQALSKATDLASPRLKTRGHSKYVVRILNNMLSLSDDAPVWWEKLSKEEQEGYITDHPGSKFAVTKKAASPVSKQRKPSAAFAKKHSKLVAPSAPAKKSHHYVPKKHKRNSLGFRLKHRNIGTLHGKLQQVWARKRTNVASTLQHHKSGLHAIHSLLTGGQLTPSQGQQAKKTAGLAMKLVLGSMLAVALLTPLAPFALILAHSYLTEGDDAKKSESSDDNDEKAPDQDFALQLTDDMVDWLESQDIPALIKKLEMEQNNA